MTLEEKVAIAIDAMKNQPLETVGLFALLRLSELGIAMNSEDTTLTCNGKFGGKEYECKMVVTYKEIN